jgi:hypothetical protein
MQGLAAVGIGAAAFGAGKLAGEQLKKPNVPPRTTFRAGRMQMQVSPASPEVN